jgi:hypothetical protein
MKMEEKVAAEPLFDIEESIAALPLEGLEELRVPKPLLAGVIYGEVVYWFMLTSIIIAVTGLAIYIGSGGGYFNSANLLTYLWQGSDCLTIWKEVGNTGQPLAWYSCLGMLAKGDMLAVLGLVLTGFAAVVGMWGAFLGMLRSGSRLYALFAFVIAAVLSLSAMGILKLH